MHRWRALLEPRSASETFRSGGEGYRANRSLWASWHIDEGSSTLLDEGSSASTTLECFLEGFPLRGRQGLWEGWERSWARASSREE